MTWARMTNAAARQNVNKDRRRMVCIAPPKKTTWREIAYSLIDINPDCRGCQQEIGGEKGEKEDSRGFQTGEP
jgi:hypothetical protein